MRQEDILDTLRKAGRPMSSYEILEHLGTNRPSDRNEVRYKLRRMEAYEQVRIHHTEIERHGTRMCDIPFWEALI